MKEQIEKILDSFTRNKGFDVTVQALTALIQSHGIQQYNKAIDDAAEAATMLHFDKDGYTSSPVSLEIDGTQTYIDKQSILTLKK